MDLNRRGVVFEAATTCPITPAETARLAEQAAESARVKAEAEVAARQVDPTLYFIARLPNELLLIIFEFLFLPTERNASDVKMWRNRVIQVCWRWRALANTKSNVYVLRTVNGAKRFRIMLKASIDARDEVMRQRKEEREKGADESIDNNKGAVEGSKDVDDKIVTCRADEVKSIQVLHEVDFLVAKGEKEDRIAKIIMMTPNVEVIEFSLNYSMPINRKRKVRRAHLLFEALTSAKKMRRFVCPSSFPIVELPSLFFAWPNVQELILSDLRSFKTILPIISVPTTTCLTSLELGSRQCSLRGDWTEQVATFITLPLVSAHNTLTRLEFSIRLTSSSVFSDIFFAAIPSTLTHLIIHMKVPLRYYDDVAYYDFYTPLDAVLLRSTQLEYLSLPMVGYSDFSCLDDASNLSVLLLEFDALEIDETIDRIEDLISHLDDWQKLVRLRVELIDRSMCQSEFVVDDDDLEELELECEARNIIFES